MDPDDVNPSEPDVMIVPFSPEEDEIIKVALKKMGYKTQDAGGNKDAHYRKLCRRQENQDVKD